MTIRVLFFLFFTYLKAFCQIAPTIDKNTQWEVYYDKVPVNGEIRVGLVSFESDEKIKPTSFFVKIPEHDENMLCVEISSRDGRYEANLPYNLMNLKPNIYEFQLPTKHIQELKQYSIKEITILTKIGKTCKSQSSYYVLSSWNKPAISEKSFVIYLNSENPTFLRYKNKGQNESLECEEIKSSSSIAYNRKCVVPYDNFVGLTEFYVQQRVRKGPNVSYITIDFPLKF